MAGYILGFYTRWIAFLLFDEYLNAFEVTICDLKDGGIYGTNNALKEYTEGTDTEYDMNNAENYAVCMVEQIRSEMKREEKTWN